MLVALEAGTPLTRARECEVPITLSRRVGSLLVDDKLGLMLVFLVHLVAVFFVLVMNLAFLSALIASLMVYLLDVFRVARAFP